LRRSAGLLAVAIACALAGSPVAHAQNPVTITGTECVDDPDNPGEQICTPSRPDLSGIQLDADETATGDAIVVPTPGQDIDATVIPGDCADASECSYELHADGGPADGAQAASVRRPKMAALNGARVVNVKMTPHAKLQPRKRTKSGKARARASVAVRVWTNNGDYVCGLFCVPWKIVLNSRAYCDGTYAWGNATRYGYRGYADKNGTHGVGYAVTTNRLGFVSDVTRYDMYAAHDATVSAVAHGVPIAYTHYVHRHYPGNCGNSWLVYG
jgi:hypothetical protein